MTTTPEITVVVGTLNRPSVVLKLISIIEDISSKIPLELLVFDQSDDVNYQKLTSKFTKKNNFHLIHLDKPNTCKYLNMGWRKARSEIVLFLDDDVTITEATIRSHIDEYMNNNIKGVAGRVINDGESISTDDNVGKCLWFGAIMKSNFSYDKKTYVDYPYGCNMSFRKKVLESVGGFDEKLLPPIYAYNEVDLGIRVNKISSNSIIFSPTALALHHRFETGGTRNNFSKKELFKSTQYNYGYFIGKNFNLIKNLIWLLRRFIYQVFNEPKAVPYIFKGLISSHATKARSSKMKPLR